jgi:hypothetical protein
MKILISGFFSEFREASACVVQFGKRASMPERRSESETLTFLGVPGVLGGSIALD